jgi:hypothetical protein
MADALSTGRIRSVNATETNSSRMFVPDLLLAFLTFVAAPTQLARLKLNQRSTAFAL